MDANSFIRSRIADELRRLGYENPNIIFNSDLDCIHVFLSVYGTSISLMIRVKVPRRKRSIPEITLLPNPYSTKITKDVKAAIRSSLEQYRESCL